MHNKIFDLCPQKFLILAEILLLDSYYNTKPANFKIIADYLKNIKF